jgi:hypothetical protein
MSNWPEPNDGERADVDLGDGHTLTWSEYGGERVGGIIRHTIPVTEQNPNGYCDGAFWIRGNAFTAQHRPNSPQWDMRYF